jgi:MFS family permease
LNPWLTRSINPWWTVVAGAAGSAVGAGTIMVYTYGILASAMGAEFGWTRELLARNMTSFLFGSGIGTISLGWLISRNGIQNPSALFAGAFGALFAAIALLPPTSLIHVMTFFAIGVAGSACTALPYSVAISGFFDKRRGLALGLVVAGSGIGSTIGPAVAQGLLSGFGWRAGFAVIGIAAAAVSVTGLMLLVRTPPGVVAMGKDAREDARRGKAAPRASFLTRQFWFIAIPILAVSVATFGGMASLVPLFRDADVPQATIVGALSFAGLCSWFGRILIGYLLDRIFAPFICVAVFLSAACGLIILTTEASGLYIYAGAAMVAMAMGAEADVLTFLVSRYFNLAQYSRVVGLMWVVWAWGGGVGTYFADRSFGVLGSYNPAFYGFAGILVLGAVVVLMLGPYRHEYRPRSELPTAPESPPARP